MAPVLVSKKLNRGQKVRLVMQKPLNLHKVAFLHRLPMHDTASGSLVHIDRDKCTVPARPKTRNALYYWNSQKNT